MAGYSVVKKIENTIGGVWRYDPITQRWKMDGSETTYVERVRAGRYTLFQDGRKPRAFSLAHSKIVFLDEIPRAGAEVAKGMD